MRRDRRRRTTLAWCTAAVASLVFAAGCGSSPGSAAVPATSSGGHSDATTGGSSASGAPITENAATLEAAGYKGSYTAPPTSGPRAEKGKNVWIISCGQASESCSVPADAAQQAGKMLGWKVTLFDAQLNPANYTIGIDKAIAAGAQGLMLIAVDCDLADAALKQAHAAGIKIVGFFSYDCNDPAINSGSPLFSTQVLFNGYSNLDDVMRAWGAMKAAWVIEHTHGHAKVIDITVPSFLVLKYLDEGFTEEMATCRGCSIVDHLSISESDLFGSAAGQKLAAALQKYPGANALHVPNDAMFAEFANADLKAAGRKNLLVIGGECFAPNIAEIRSGGPEDACNALPQQWTAFAAMDELNRQFAAPGSAPVDEGEGFQLVDGTHNLPATGGWVPTVNFVADYQRVWDAG
jgi:ribose transport system substrate-binding protein